MAQNKDVQVAMCLFVATMGLILNACELDKGWQGYNWFVIISLFIMAVYYTWLEHIARKQNWEYWNSRIK